MCPVQCSAMVAAGGYNILLLAKVWPGSATVALSDWIRRRCTWWGLPGELIVERDGRAVALLDDRQFHEMFWWAWRITPLTDDPHENTAIFSGGFWDDSQIERTVFRSKASGEVADTAFWPASQPIRDGRLILRGAYGPVPVRFRRTPILWLRLLLIGGGALEPPPEDTSPVVPPRGATTRS